MGETQQYSPAFVEVMNSTAQLWQTLCYCFHFHPWFSNFCCNVQRLRECRGQFDWNWKDRKINKHQTKLNKYQEEKYQTSSCIRCTDETIHLGVKERWLQHFCSPLREPKFISPDVCHCWHVGISWSKLTVLNEALIILTYKLQVISDY